MGTQPTQARERERSDKDRERERSSKADQAVASGSSSSSQRVGNYRLDGEIGRGSFATVYLGYKGVSHPRYRWDIADLSFFINFHFTKPPILCPTLLQTEINHSHRSQGCLPTEAHGQTTRKSRERNKHPQVNSQSQHSSITRLLCTFFHSRLDIADHIEK